MVAVELYNKNSEYILKHYTYHCAGNDDSEMIEKCEKCIVCNNSGYSEDYVTKRIKQYLLKGKDVLCLFPICEKNRAELRELSLINNCEIIYAYEERNFQGELKNIDVPVIYIAGAGIACDQLEYHDALAEILVGKGVKVLNISNIPEAIALEYYYFDIDRIVDNDRGNEVQKINSWVYNLQAEKNADVIIFSNKEGIVPLNETEQSYGILNHYMKYAVPYDYVLFCLYINLFDSIDFDKLSFFLESVVNESNIHYAISKNYYDKMNGYESVFDVLEEDYEKKWNGLKNNERVIALCDKHSLNNYIESMVKNGD